MPEVKLVTAEVLSGAEWLALEEACDQCRVALETVLELAELGALELRSVAVESWALPLKSLPRLRLASRLMRDLGVNASGAALIVDLLDSRRELESRLAMLERLVGGSR